jgi:hypothetical protein
MNIALTPEIENALATEAEKQGTTPELLALDALRKRFVAPHENGASEPSVGNLADFLAGHIGVLSSSEFIAGGANMSVDCGKKFAAGLSSRRKNGKQ